MILLGRVPNPRMAQAFIDYLFNLDIDCQLRQQQGFELWLVTTDQQQLAQDEFEQFIVNPSHPKYLAASWTNANPQISAVGHSAANVEMLANFISHSGPVTLVTFGVAVVVYLSYLLGFNFVYQALAFFPSLELAQVSQIWRLFTPTLLHFSTLHILFNLVMWWYLGGLIENKVSSSKLLVILVLASIFPNIVQYLMTGPAFGGLSGVVYALVGYVWWRNPKVGLYLPPAYIGFMLVWLVMGFFDLMGIKVANGAHVGGLIVGCLLAWFDNKRESNK
ncbi:MAG: rhomboid family intramembrane serine protease GlpG [Gammaproteobacteria bacterium]|nr:rhomboid family intramembrane serine protease GlpG [Gammaproteobacteria bacterium]